MKHSDDVVERWKRDRDIYERQRVMIRGGGFRYNELTWRDIKKSLDHVGVDADTTTMTLTQEPYSLRTGLEQLAQRYRSLEGGRMPTAQEYSDAITGDVQKVATARDLFAVSSKSWLLGLLDDKRAAELHELLSAVETELRELVELDGRSNFHETQHNADKLELRWYLLNLAEVWDELIDGKSMAQRWRNDFVWVCAAPVTGIKKRNVRTFLSSGFALGQ